MLRDQDGNLLTEDALRRKIYRLKHLFRSGVAHEVASALSLRQRHIQDSGHVRSTATADEYLAQLLSEYLVMSHHGRVRKVLRDEIPKNPKGDKNRSRSKELFSYFKDNPHEGLVASRNC